MRVGPDRVFEVMKQPTQDAPRGDVAAKGRPTLTLSGRWGRVAVAPVTSSMISVEPAPHVNTGPGQLLRPELYRFSDHRGGRRVGVAHRRERGVVRRSAGRQW